MIPYEDLVVALQTWRARRGLPVGQMSGSFVPPVASAAPPPVSTPPPVAARTAPPHRPPTAPAARPPAPAPLAPLEEHLDVADDSLLEETSYDAEGNFTMSFGGGPPVRDSEATSIGMPPPAPPPRASDATMVGGEPSETVDGLPPPPATPRNRGDW
ncbi:MAG: hypothetical protein KF773_22075 [Deltaproteobacteria bacterium]|nr:hypothetical protein [Deltaproteobacteria bacterium]